MKSSLTPISLTPHIVAVSKSSRYYLQNVSRIQPRLTTPHLNHRHLSDHGSGSGTGLPALSPCSNSPLQSSLNTVAGAILSENELELIIHSSALSLLTVSKPPTLPYSVPHSLMALLFLQGAFAMAVPSAWDFLPSDICMAYVFSPCAYTMYIKKERETVFKKKEIKE